MDKNYGDLIFEKIGSNGRYQILVLTILILICTISDSYYVLMTLMQTPPKIENINGEIVDLNYDICKSGEYTLRRELSKDTWVMDYDIYCSKLYTSLLGSSICFGSILGSISSRLIKVLGHKKSFIIYCLIIVFGSAILFIKNYYCLIFSNICFGISNVGMIIIKNTIITEFTNKINRSYFMFGAYSTAFLSNVINYSIFKIGIGWRLFFGINLISMLLFMVPFQLCFVENPRFYLLKKDEKNMIESMMKISKINGIDVIEDELIHFVQGFSSKIVEKSTEEFNIHQHEKIISNHSKRLLILHMIIFFVYTIQNMSVTFELKFYSNDVSLILYNTFMVLSVFSFVIISFMMNLSFLGRKHSINTFLIIIVVIRFLKTVLNCQTLLFLISRLCVYTSQVPIHTLITESFSTKDRVTFYGYIYFGGKIAAVMTPFILDYLPSRSFDYVMIFSALLQLFFTVFTKETFNLSLDD